MDQYETTSDANEKKASMVDHVVKKIKSTNWKN